MASGKLHKVIKEVLEEKKRDRCLRIADRKYDKPSAYKSGAVVRCRQGKIWKDLKEGVWSQSALSAMHRKSRDAKYFLTDENGNILTGPYKLKTMASVHKTFKIAKIWGGFSDGEVPKIINVHDLKKDGEVVEQYEWTEKGAYLKDVNPQYIKYKDLKESKQVGPLYHYTSAEGLKGILSSNRMNAAEEYYLGNDLYYISFTRNKNFHNKGSKFGVKTDYRITLDGDKLSNRYKISPFAYKPGWNYKDNWEYDWLEDEPESVVRDFFNNTGEYDEQEERISFRGPEGGIDDIKNYILAIDKVENLQEDESLRKWFSRKGAKGSTSGWVDCNAPDGKGGYKACGRQKGEKRSKYPACRPTPSACKDKGKGKTWGKKSKK